MFMSSQVKMSPVITDCDIVRIIKMSPVITDCDMVRIIKMSPVITDRDMVRIIKMSPVITDCDMVRIILVPLLPSCGVKRVLQHERNELMILISTFKGKRNVL
ncbi:unnamed protein product [Boreogadus saida]